MDGNELALFRALPDPEARRALVEQYSGLAIHLANRYRYRGLEHEDLEQVAMLGLLGAIDRFDPDFGVAFTSFAIPSITGELKRHFRDSAWSISVPRRLRDVSTLAGAANERLSQRLGRAARVDEIAVEIDATEEEVLEVAALGTAYRPESLDEPVTETGATRLDVIGDEDVELGVFDEMEALLPLLASRSERERRIIHLRFVEELTQQEIADRVGISQMHVSRILRSTLDQLRVLLEAVEA